LYDQKYKVYNYFHRFDDADVKPLLPDLAASSSSYHHQAGGPGAALGLAPRVPRFSTYPFRPVSGRIVLYFKYSMIFFS
jgi:hypothetical protein